MQTKISHLSDLKFNLETWRRELRFHFNEMDTFEEQLEEIAARKYNKNAAIQIEQFQNRILLEKDAIAKLKHRCKNKMAILNKLNFCEDVDARYRSEHRPLMKDMRTYIKMHYELKEEMMAFFLNWLE
ncbi:hypothetical protein MPF19_14275 [Polaribacter sp. Z014]|uniref:hypothetical protein n=1 Tax=unclassified Polaribacter TaxID=196858 RepID=UPI00193BB13E|nr:MULTISPECIES: hypothetical protein [unclassified Polaribacter]MCL7764586.1 hypothetical protein [Polaribacter sp. Z014]QVY66365.1 hypothetical protein JOP69_03475 [Polaribacter sp. Q13]